MKTLSKNSKILTAVKPGPGCEQHLQKVYKFAQRFSFDIELFVVVEPFNDVYLHTLYGIPATNTHITSEIDETRVNQTKKLLDKESLNAPSDIKVTTNVVLGELKESILKRSSEIKAAAIVLGSKNEYGIFDTQLSNTLDIMDEAECPVIVFPENSEIHPETHMELLVCDDLSSKGMNALVFARSFANEHRGVGINHINIIEEENLHVPEEVSQILLGSIENSVAPDEKALVNAAQASLLNRFSLGVSSNDTSSIQYENNACVGDTYSKIKEYSEKEKADFIVLGEHSLLKVSPFGTGRISWNKMVTLKKPIIIAKG